MGTPVHKYFCKHCNLYLFGETATRLAGNVNTHNTRVHPIDFNRWDASGIVLSAQYSAPSDAPPYISSYVRSSSVVFSKEWGDAKPPDITEQDRLMLAKGGVRW